MQKAFRYSRVAFGAFLALMIAGPQPGMAQRFNHGGGGGGRPVAPPVMHPVQVARPTPTMRPAPASRPVETRPAEPRPVVERPTINGGSRNIGNHDLARPVEVVHDAVNARSNVTVRDHVNVYHTGRYRGIHPYYYHPYRPYYWGPHWHPLGFFLSSLATDAIWFSFNNQRYWYDDGCFYLPQNGGYAVVPAPVGAIVATIPPGYETPVVDGTTYYYFGGVFYVYTGQGYQVVTAPPGAVIYQLPDGATDQQIDGQDFLVYNNTWYEPVSQDGQDAYEVVPPPGQ
ncbi:MAG TPA: DUF6515 family protein [Puia sp.]|nr:DUF6515 family protein [Puia sp.]